MSRRSTRKKAATPDLEDEVVPAKHPKLVETPEEEEVLPTSNENEPPKPAHDEEAAGDKSAQHEDADVGDEKEKLHFRIDHCTS